MAPSIACLRFAEQHERQMREHLLACLPEEGCGLLGGRWETAPGVGGAQQAVCQMALAVPNVLHSPVRFRMAPQQQLRAFQAIEAAGLDLLAVFHSHPTGPDHPSQTDLAEFAYPGVLYLIWSPGADGWQRRAYRLEAGQYHQVMIEVAFEDF